MIRQLPTLKIHPAILAVLLAIASTAHAETTSGTLVVGPGETLVIGTGVERRHNGAIVVSAGRIEVNGGKLFLSGSMMILQAGAVVFDTGEFHHEGNDTHVLVGGPGPEGGDGLLAFRNGGRYHFAQTYVSQHELHVRNNSRIELDGTKISADAGTSSFSITTTCCSGLAPAKEMHDCPPCTIRTPLQA
jgi:hypothetical protein